MRSKVTIAGHPIHTMLVAFPIAFYTATLVSYIVYWNCGDPFWFKVGVVANIAGSITALVAAVPGFIDWLNIPSNRRAKKTGVFHMVANVVALALYTVAAFTVYNKWDDAEPALGVAIPLTAVGFSLTMIAGFLGWTLVQKHHIGVDDVAKD